MGIRILIFILLIACKGETVRTEKKQPVATKSPNVIYILADDLGYGDIGCYGQDSIATPNLDLMASEGMKFNNHYSGSTICAPSRASLMTGLHQGHAPVRGNSKNVLGDSDFTLAQMFYSQGYATKMIGKWGLGEMGSTGEPDRKGFDSYYGYLNQIHAHNYYPDHLVEDGIRIPLANEVIYAKEGYAQDVGSSAVKKEEYTHSMFIEQAIHYIEAPKDRPFFLYLALTVPHANNEGKLTAQHGMEVPSLGNYVDKDWPEVEKAKAAMVSLMDADIGRILEALVRSGIDEETMVIFTSDNGPHAEGGVNPDFFHSNGKLRGIKRDLFEGGIRVPFIARWPGTIPQNSTSDHISAFWDMLPTFAELTGYSAAFETDGISLLPTLIGRFDRQRPHEFLYWEFAEGEKEAQAIRKGDWKLLYELENDTWQLYNLKNDTAETHNVIAENPVIFKELKSKMAIARVPHEAYPIYADSIGKRSEQ